MDIPNAFATGRDPRHAACAVTEGILRLLNEDELEGVLAHELSHIKHRDILIASVVATIAGAISMLAYMARWAAFGESRNRDARLRMIGLLVVSLFAPLAAMIVQLAISRSEEYRADASGARISKKPLGLASALNKLSLYKAQGFQRQEPNPATAHMFIVNPLSASGFNALFSTHPPIEKRILELKKIAATQPS